MQRAAFFPLPVVPTRNGCLLKGKVRGLLNPSRFSEGGKHWLCHPQGCRCVVADSNAKIKSPGSHPGLDIAS
jgi:hypothetical protein